MDLAQTIGQFIGTFPQWLILPAVVLIFIILVILFYSYEILPWTPNKTDLRKREENAKK